MFQIILIIIFVIGDYFIIKEYFKTMKTNKRLEYRVEYLEKRLDTYLHIDRKNSIFKD